jgi:hypothetical protein
MKTISTGVIGAALLLAALSPASRADGSSNSVRWETIIGTFFIGATPGTSSNTVGGNTTVSPPIPGIIGGGQPWSTLGGHTYVDLSTGDVDFEVNGLVLAGGNGIGTTGGVTPVQGTLVCAPGSTTQMVFNTTQVPLSAQGYAEFHGSFGALPSICTTTNVAFLITIVSNGHWIANGAVRVP